MTFKRFEFWLVTLVILVQVAIVANHYYNNDYLWYLRENNNLPGINWWLATLGIRLGYILTINAVFVFQNFIVFGRFLERRKYNSVFVLTLLSLFFLFLSFNLLESFQSGQHTIPFFKGLIEFILVSYGVYLLYKLIRGIVLIYVKKVKVSPASPLKRKIIKEVVISFIIWFLIFIVVANANTGMYYTLFPFWVFWVPCSFFLIMLNVYLLIPHYEKENKGFSTFLINTFLVTLLLSFVFGVPFANGNFWGFTFFISTQLIISVPLAWFIYQSNKEKIQQLLFLKKELGRTTADLQFLRSQINPHFLFNALNTLYGTALQENSERTAVGIQKLGDMMRFMLHENVQETIPLEKEVEYLLNYISLQQLRTLHSDDIKIEVQLDDEDLQYRIAPMLLIPFVENAFKHGISLKEQSWIKISLSCKNDKLYFDVYNSIHSKKEADPEKDKSGIGLANVKQRLEMIYPEKHELIIRETASEFIVHLTVTFEPLKSPSANYSATSGEEPLMGIRSSQLQ